MPTAPRVPRRRRRLGIGLLSLTTLLTPGLVAFTPSLANASTVSSAAFTGGTGTVTVGSTVSAKQGGALTLTVSTSSDTKCVDVSGAFSGHQQFDSTRSSWTFTFTAPSGDGVQTVTVAASPGFNAQNKCTGAAGTSTASYTLDNTGPVVSAALTPAPNGAGWNNGNVSVAWTATDTGSGVAGSQPFQTDSVSANGIATLTAPAQTDRLGNLGSSGSQTVRVDKAAPSISATQTQNSDGTTTITFTCTDSGSGGGDASGIATCLAGGSTTNSRTVGPSTTVTGTATDNAGNTATTTSTSPAGDTTPPTLTGSPTTAPDGTNSWYKSNVTIHWTCTDNNGGSGIAAGACPADDTISSEGQNLTVTRSLSDIAGNKTSATSSPAVKIDKTAPTTSIGGASNAWTNHNVTVTLTPSDNLSGVASTTYTVDGGGTQTGTSLNLSSDGDHTITYSSTDVAGNAEAVHTAHVKIDQTAPTIGHTFDPSSYLDGAWTNVPVTVTFTCADQGGSGLAGCIGSSTVSSQTTVDGQQIVGTATDGAGNTATDPVTVRVDTTPPTITAAPDRTPDSNGWYNHNVTVTFAASDALSGLAHLDSPKTLGEGDNQSVTGTATDAAGNTAGSTLSGIRIDKTPPVLTGSFTPGWHTGDVTVTWDCTDGLSGVASKSATSTTVTGEGANLTATASCTDVAGNVTTNTVDGIQIDRTAPTTQAAVPTVPAGGWYKAGVPVTLTGSDNLSGIAATYYSIDGGTAQTYDGVFSFDTEGQHTITFWSKDGTGNLETAGAPLTLKIDKTAPTTAVTNPISPASGWFVTTGIPVAFEAHDNAGGSGIAATYYTIDNGTAQTYGGPFTATLAVGTHTITYWSVDLAGNEEAHATTNTVTVQVDTVAPTVTPGDVVNSTWRNTPLSQTFTASDADSGLADAADASFTLIASLDSPDASTPTIVSKPVSDKAGNTTTRSLSALIDTVPPAVNLVGGPVGGTTYVFGSVPPAPTCSASDTLSGLKQACQVTGYSQSVGPQTVTATATDNAGNTATARLSYTVGAWTLKGFYAPVDMSSMAGPVWNTVKGGSTVPLKFQVFAGSTELTTTSAITGFSQKVVGCPSASAVTDAIEEVLTGGTSLRYDTTGGQFIQNWQTPKKAGTCYLVTMTTQDGSTVSANFMLK